MIYDRPITPFHRDASTVVEHATSFAEHSRLGALQVNADSGFPAGLDELEFDAVILHYSLFGMARYRLDEGFLRYLKDTGAYKVAFFQDEYFACQRRFAFLNEYEIDCVYTCLEPDQFDQVYGRYTGVPQLVSTLTGYVSDHLLDAAARFAKPDSQRAVDVGYRGRPLPAYLGRGAQEKTLIGERFAELAAGSGLRLDIAGAEADRLYGDDWYRFLADCRCLLGVESGAVRPSTWRGRYSRSTTGCAPTAAPSASTTSPRWRAGTTWSTCARSARGISRRPPSGSVRCSSRAATRA